MAKKKTTKRATAAAVAGAADGSALAIFAVSLRKMANFYASHPSPGLIQPIDAIQMALCDAAGAAEYAAQGKQWVKPGVWKKPNADYPDHPSA
jgi:hypothetical protein